jgi:alkanesulfonate monooxygenase SsuD/methylene tetrahydromethanopterin reductase-like flavin-dependent oxidoreductase (luciferase family)
MMEAFMRFSVFLTYRSMSPEEDAAVLEATIEHALRVEELGFDAVFSPDHHFTGYAPWASDSFMFASYLAAQLKRVHFGFSVTTLPLHHPVRFVEKLNLLDQLTHGRLLVGIGSGTTPEESIGFGVKFQEASRMLGENLEIALKLWAKKVEDEPVQFETSVYKGAVVQRIAPAAYTKPHPRLMTVAMRDTSVALAAQHGWPAFINSFTPPVIGSMEPETHFSKYFTKYRDALVAAGHAQEVIADCLSWTTRTYQIIHVAETDEQAREELQFILKNYKAAVEREYAYNKRAEAICGLDLNPPPDPFDEGWIKTWCLVGSPDTVAAEIQKFADLGAGNILGSFTHGPLTPERRRLADRALELFAREVLPRFA